MTYTALRQRRIKQQKNHPSVHRPTPPTTKKRESRNPPSPCSCVTQIHGDNNKRKRRDGGGGHEQTAENELSFFVVVVRTESTPDTCDKSKRGTQGIGFRAMSSLSLYPYTDIAINMYTEGKGYEWCGVTTSTHLEELERKKKAHERKRGRKGVRPPRLRPKL